MPPEQPLQPARRRPWSLALRITLILSCAMTLLFAAFALQVERSINRHFVAQDLGELQAVAGSLDAALAVRSPSLQERLANAVTSRHGMYFSVTDDGREAGGIGTAPAVLVDAAAGTPATPTLDAQTLRIWATDAATYRGAVLRLHGARVLVAMAIDFHLGYLTRLRHWLLWSTLAVCAVAIAAAWLAVRWGHAPIRRLSGAIGGVGPDQLHRRLEAGEVPVELEHLVLSFNRMLERLQQSFERLSHFSADIAHELRTPVTNLTTHTQVALAKPRPAEAYREVLYDSLDELERLGKMIGDMLFLAQSEQPGAKPEVAAVDLAVEVRALFDYFDAWAEALDVRLCLVGAESCVQGDRAMLRRALANLISNGLRHTPAGQCLTVRLAQVDASVRVDVENPGPDIAAEHLPRLFDRFYRADPARRRSRVGDGDNNDGGVGLGLAIVKSIVAAHGGAVNARSGGGTTCFSVLLPAPADLVPGAARPAMQTRSTKTSPAAGLSRPVN